MAAVALAAYNGAHHIRTQPDSLLAQTYWNFKIVIRAAVCFGKVLYDPGSALHPARGGSDCVGIGGWARIVCCLGRLCSRILGEIASAYYF